MIQNGTGNFTINTGPASGLDDSYTCAACTQGSVPIAGGGRFSILSNDGNDVDIVYNFCQPVTNPYIYM
ncbi:MAG: hypothetical protein D6714_09485 [Bacteroidetes bacterium]|nr:MAG: hypothetical protein D6714_09485 [Bacteroidota bacterium]